MTTNLGMPIWYELLTSDTAAAKRFYGDVVGWTTDAFPGGGGGDGGAGGGAGTGGADMEYSLWKADDGAAVGGLMPLPADFPTGPGWLAYFHVADVDAAIATVEATGGTVHVPPQDVPGVGRFAMVADPQGVPFYVMTPAPTEPGYSTSFSPTLPQRCAWNELVTSDQDAGLRFYAGLFGWTSPGAMPMGDSGAYTFISCGDAELGAMMNSQAPAQPRRWGFYFHIPDVDAAVVKITDAGGQVLMGPMDVPGGQRIVVAIDPQGAAVGFVSGAPA